MRIAFEVHADPRNDQGKGASRRLRRSGKVPAILYGGAGEARNLTMDHQNLMTLVGNEKFYSTIINIVVGSEKQPAIIKDVQMHPARNAVVHVDLQRVSENEKIRIFLPIHFNNAAASPGVKTQGGIVSHLRADIEVVCLPKDLPESIELDLSGMNLNDTLSLSDIKLPDGVVIPELAQGRDAKIVSIHSPRAEEPEAAAAVATVAEGAAAPAAAGDAKKDDGKGDAKAAAPAKKEGGKK
ncbi:MAG: 50S ribosomal protein L25/general stress protein Ctc [Steroidobacteraceae bacterium]